MRIFSNTGKNRRINPREISKDIPKDKSLDFALSFFFILLLKLTNMEVNFDQYIRNFRMFYNQLVKGHPK